MKINSITPNYYVRNSVTNQRSQQHSPSFKADYSDKPVPPAGKAVAAASAIALISGAIYHGVSEFGHKEEPQQNGIEYVFNAAPNDGDFEDINVVDSATFKKVIKKEQERIAARDTTDTIPNDTILSADTIKYKQDPKIGHFNGQAYEVIPKGDTVVLVPVVNPKTSDIKNGKGDSLDKH